MPSHLRRIDEKCQKMIKSNPDGKTLSRSELVRESTDIVLEASAILNDVNLASLSSRIIESVKDSIVTFDVAMWRRWKRKSEKMEPIDIRFLNYLRKKKGKKL